MKKYSTLAVLVVSMLFSISTQTKADFNKDGYFEIPSNFDLFTSQNFKGYTKPLFTTIGQGAQSNLYSRASYDEFWSIGMDLSLSSTIIPNSQRTYTAELPKAFGDQTIMDNAIYKDGKIVRNITSIEQPTIYGGESNAIYVVAPLEGGDPADSIYKSVAFNEGNDISTMASLPALQFYVGLPTRTEIRLRYLGAPVQDQMYNHLAIAANQQIDHWMELFNPDDKMALAFNASYQFMTLAETVDMNSWSFGFHFSKEFTNGLAVYSGLQLEDLSGKFKVVRENGYNPDFYDSETDELKSVTEIPESQLLEYAAHVMAREDVKNSPYEEVKKLKPLEFDIETFTNWRFLVGGSYEYGIAEFHLDLGYASQIFVNGGLRLRFYQWDGDEVAPE